MRHFLFLEKSREQHDAGVSAADTAVRADGVPQYMYMLLPDEGGYQVVRAPLHRILEIAEPVTDPSAELRAARAVADIQISDGDVRPTTLAIGAGTATRRVARRGVVKSARARFGDVHIDLAAREVTKAGRPVPLAPMEFNLLLALVRRGGAAASRAELMHEVWACDAGITHRTVDTHIFNLRKKLEDNPARPRFILTVSKVGYRLKG